MKAGDLVRVEPPDGSPGHYDHLVEFKGPREWRTTHYPDGIDPDFFHEVTVSLDMIPKFTRSAPYETTVPWDMIEGTLARYDECGVLQLDPEFQRAHVWDNYK